PPSQTYRRLLARRRMKRIGNRWPTSGWNDCVTTKDSEDALDGVAVCRDRRNAQRPLPPVGLRDVRPFDRLRSIRSALQPSGQVREVLLEGLSVMPPRLAIDPRGRGPLQGEVRGPQMIDVVDVVQERREPHLLVPLSNSTYPLQRTGRALPVL